MANILDTIKKLHIHAESAKAIGSDAEAQAFAAKVNELLNKHRLELSDIDFETKRKAEPVDQAEINFYKYDIRTRKARVDWIEHLAGIVARAHSCDILVLKGTSRIWLVGSKSNREVAEYLLVTLMRSAEAIAEKEYVRYYYKCKDDGDVTRARGYRHAFLMGFITRIAERFEEAKAKMNADPTGTALIRFNQEAADVAAYVVGLHKKPAAGLKVSIKSSRGYRDGQAKADAMNIHCNGVNEGRGPSGQLR